MGSTVSIISCTEYKNDLVEIAVRELLEPLGGMGAFINTRERVLIKPNLLSDSKPEKNVTTHPSVVRAVVKLIKEAGATPVIGDDPGLSNFTKAAKAAGIEAVALETGTELVPFKTSVPVEIDELLKACETAPERIAKLLKAAL